jgi:hypothetical protein
MDPGLRQDDVINRITGTAQYFDLVEGSGAGSSYAAKLDDDGFAAWIESRITNHESRV